MFSLHGKFEVEQSRGEEVPGSKKSANSELVKMKIKHKHALLLVLLLGLFLVGSRLVCCLSSVRLIPIIVLSESFSGNAQNV